MGNFSQTHRLFQVTTPFGEDTLLFGRMKTTEQLSRPFEFVVTALSERSDLDADEILGRPVTVKVATQATPPRYFQGLAADFAYVDYVDQLYQYRLTLRPWLWFLTQTSDCRTFQGKTVPDIVQEVCRQAGFTDLRLLLSGSYDPREYCVQLRETDFNFVSRLLEQEGIFYFFEHSASKHELVLCDDVAQLTSVPGSAQVPFLPAAGVNQPQEEINYLSSWVCAKSLRSGTYATRQFEFKTPSPILAGTSTISRAYDSSRYETFDFPALAATSTSAAVQKVTQVRVQELQTGQTFARGSGNAPNLTTGKTFELQEHPREDFNVRWLVSSTSIEMSNSHYMASTQGTSSEFGISIEAMLASEPYRPARVTSKPLVHGLQSALVVGPKSSEIYTDEYGRVKVQFHWDRQGKMDENSSCWIRVAQTWAGKSWGAQQLPRIGQEVIIDFLDGDPDRPVVVGCLYNGANKPPYELPAQATRSGVRSRSSMQGTSGNEIFFEDKKGEEQLYVQAQKDHRVVVKHDMTTTVGNDQTVAVSGNQKISVSGNQTFNVGGNVTINAIGSITLKVGPTSLTLSEAGVTLSTLGDVSVNGLNITVGGPTALAVSVLAPMGEITIESQTGILNGPKVSPLSL